MRIVSGAMSKSPDDWKRILAQAVAIRRLIREAIDELDEWEYVDIGEKELYSLEKLLETAVERANTLIGKCYHDEEQE